MKKKKIPYSKCFFIDYLNYSMFVKIENIMFEIPINLCNKNIQLLNSFPVDKCQEECDIATLCPNGLPYFIQGLKLLVNVLV